jgi:hypothetical protein
VADDRDDPVHRKRQALEQPAVDDVEDGLPGVRSQTERQDGDEDRVDI